MRSTNLIKVLIFFIIGFSSRVFVNYFFDVNVFIDCFSYISFIYSFIMAWFVVTVNHFVEALDFSTLLEFFPNASDELF